MDEDLLWNQRVIKRINYNWIWSGERKRNPALSVEKDIVKNGTEKE